MTRRNRLADGFFLATLFCVTFEKVRWEVAGTVNLADLVTILFLVAFVAERTATGDERLPKSAVVLLAFLAAFLAVYLIGFFNLDTKQALDQFGKGLVKFFIHFAFLVAAVAQLARRSERFYWQSVTAFVAGITFNACYGVLQLAAAESGHNLDKIVLSPITHGASAINVYGAVQGTSVYRPNALTGDPNHLGIMLVVPLLALAPVYLRLERGHRLRLSLGILLGFLVLIEAATLSRSGALGLAAGLLVLWLPYRRRLVSWVAVAPLAGVAVVLAYVVSRRPAYFETVARSRLQTGGASTTAHFGVYDFIPSILHTHPFFGLGLNNFSVYYEFVTGKDNWGPHSFYVALIVETGLVGTALFALFLLYLFRRLHAGRAVAKLLALRGDPAAARVWPLAWGMTAALVGTMAANAFYLTMQFYYFYAFAALAAAVPLVFRRRLVA